MLKFISKEFEQKVKECMLYMEENEKGRGGLHLDFYNINDASFNPAEYEDITIDEEYIVTISPDESDEDFEITLREFLDLMDETKSAKLINNVLCSSKKRCLARISSSHYKDLATLDLLLSESSKIFNVESINNVNFTCSITTGVTLFGIMVHFSDDFDKHYPSVVSEDYFIEIIFSEVTPCQEDINKIINAYIFEVYATHGIKLFLNPRPDGYFDEIDEEETLEKSYICRPLLFGKGIDDVLKLFNVAEDGLGNYDFSIIQYTKVIEYVSQTVIRQEITNKALNKLMTSKALNPDANYIKELEGMFLEFKQKYDTDRSAIKITIKTCCDIFEVIDYAPKFLDKVINLSTNINKKEANKDAVLEAAYDSIADSISDTRNFIAHAKANYTLKGKECPEDQKGEFVNVLRTLAIQVIRWFSTTHEGSRIVS